MKRIVSLILALAAALLCACGGGAAAPGAVTAETTAAPVAVETQAVSSVKTLSFYKDIQTLSDTRGELTLCTVSYPALALDEQGSGEYAALARALTALNAESAQNSRTAYEQLLAAAQADLARREQSAQTQQAESGEGEIAPFEMFYRYDDLILPRADSRAVSILYSMTSFSGGVHGNYYYYSTNLDTVTGRSLVLSDVVLDMARLRTLLEEELRRSYPEADFSGAEEALNGYFSDPASITWTLEYQGISFYFSPGELTAYEEGTLVCSIRFDDAPGLFSEYYTAVPASYVLPFFGDRCMNYDMNADGAADEVSVKRMYSADGSEIEQLEITVNGKAYHANTPMLDCTLYLVNIASARHYLFVSAQNLTGYGYISVYKLDRSGAALVGMLYDSSLYAASYAEVCPGVPLLTNPDSFAVGTRIRYLGTLTGLKTYCVGADGMPSTQETYYALYGAAPLTLKSQLITATIDEAGSGTFAAVTLAPGTRMSFLRSDGEGAVDMVTDEGVYCRLYVSGNLGAQYVNGMAAENLFDGMG